MSQLKILDLHTLSHQPSAANEALEIPSVTLKAENEEQTQAATSFWEVIVKEQTQGCRISSDIGTYQISDTGLVFSPSPRAAGIEIQVITMLESVGSCRARAKSSLKFRL